MCQQQKVKNCWFDGENTPIIKERQQFPGRNAGRLTVNGPSLPRQMKTPRRFESASTDGYSFPNTPVDHYGWVYYEAIDLITTCINNRFDQPGYKIYCNIQDLLLKAASTDN